MSKPASQKEPAACAFGSTSEAIDLNDKIATPLTAALRQKSDKQPSVKLYQRLLAFFIKILLRLQTPVAKTLRPASPPIGPRPSLPQRTIRGGSPSPRASDN
jgi:hypothetical protein